MDSQRFEEREQRRRDRWERRSCATNPAGGAVFAVIIMGFGLLFLLRNLNIVYVDDIWRFWPVILIGIGASKFLSPRGMHNVFPGLIVGGVGVFFLLQNLDIIRYRDAWQWLWPLLLIGFGASMLIRHLDGGERVRQDWAGPVGVNASAPGDSKMKIDVVFSGTRQRVASQEFAGGKVEAVFGGAEIDLRGAGMKLPEVTIKAEAVFGGITFRVPEAWDVDVRGGGVFGTVENLTRKPQFVGGVTHPRLIIRADAVFGNVVVKN